MDQKGGYDLKKTMKKNGSRVIAVLMAALMLTVPLAAFAAQNNADINANVATYEAVNNIVAGQVDNVYGTIKGSISNYAAQLVYDTIGNKTAIKNLAKPLVEDAIKKELKNYNISHAELDKLIDQSVEKIIDNAFIDKVLDNEFVQAVLARTVRYATSDIIDRLHIDADRDQQVSSITNHIWNANLVSVGTATTKVKSDLPVVAAAGAVANSSYYNFSVVSWNKLFSIKTTPKEINVTGWNSTNIGVYITGTVGLNTASKYNSYTSALKSMDYQEIIISAAKRAIKDEIKERLNAMYMQGKTKVLTCLNGKLASIGVSVTLNPNDSFKKIASDIEAALRAKAIADAQAKYEDLLSKLLKC
jgi:hypothetical protein